MATTLTSSLSAPIRASLGSESTKPNPNRKKPASSSSANWWTPLFGWSSEPDYITNTNEKKQAEADPGSDSGRARSRFALGCFTEEKAKQLRKKTAEGSSFHDIMYHSAIASRLASEASVWPEK